MNIISGVENKHVTDVKINDGIVANKTVVGSFVKNTAEVQIINLNHTYDDLLGKEIDIQGFGTWYVNDLSTDEEFTESKLSLYDITYKFDADYEDSFPFPATMGEWATWIGNKVGVPLKGDFLNSDLTLKEKPYLGQNPKYRDAVQKIAKYASSYARKNYDNTYSICWFENLLTEIEDWEDFVHGNTTNKTNVIILSTGDTEDNVKWPEIKPQNPYELRIEDEWTNIDRYTINEVIYNQVNGFFYTPISKLNVPYGLLELRAGQKIKTQDMELQDIETYISKVTLEWQGGEFDDLNAWTTSLQMEELNETSTKLEYANGKRNRLLNVERLADKNNGLIQDLIEETSEYEDRITSVEQTANEIVQKVESKIDFTRNASGKYKVIIEDAQAGPLIGLRISGEMELLYPSDDLYPSDELYPLDSYLIVEDEDKLRTKWKLPIDHLYKLDEICDEFVIERLYNEETELFEQHMKVIRRIYVDDDGNKAIASNERIEDLGLIEINLSKGKNTIWLESFYNVPLDYYVEYGIVNDFTKEFATKGELKNSITQTENSINLELEKKVDDVTLTGANIMLRINEDESQAVIQADKIDLKGYVTVSDLIDEGQTVINGSNITTGTLSADRIKGGTMTGASFKGTSDDSSIINIGSNNLAGASQNGFLNISDSNGTLRLSLGSRYKDTVLEELSFYSPSARFFSFVSNQSDNRVNANAFSADSYIYSPAYNGGSLESIKKNISLYEKECINIIQNADIYEYNLKIEEDTDKKHIGLIIGDEGGNYNTPLEIITKNHDGIDLYSMISVAWKAIQEQQETINILSKRIEVLENEIFKNN